MSYLPYHHDWKLAFQIETGLRVHWCGRYAGYASWHIPTARLAADMINFFYVEKQACWVVINGRRLMLEAGDLLVVSGADEFTYGHDPQRPHTSLSIALALQQGGLANSLLQRKFERKYRWPRPAEYVAEFEKLLQAMTSRSAFRDLKVGGALLQWLGYLLDHTRPPLDAAATAERAVVDKILLAENWAHARLKKTVQLDDWARAVGLNAVYFGRIFKRETGLRPMEWLNQRRLQLACQHLSGSSQTVAAIAEACGFSSQFYFSRVFRKQFGQSPLQYRKKHL